jgi:hypothetical protein
VRSRATVPRPVVQALERDEALQQSKLEELVAEAEGMQRRE